MSNRFNSESVLRLCDVTEEGLVVLELPGVPYQPHDKLLRLEAYEDLRRTLGANGTLLSIGRVSRGYGAHRPRRRP